MCVATELQETNSLAARNNWWRIAEMIDIPDMNSTAQAKQALGWLFSVLKLITPAEWIKLGIRTAILTIKMVIKYIKDMLRLPIVHWDPAMKNAHVLMLHRSPIDPVDSATRVVLRDMIDNSTWNWINLEPDAGWIDTAGDTWVNALANEWHEQLFKASNAKQYNKLKVQYLNAIDVKFFQTGVRPLLDIYMEESKAAEAKQMEKYMAWCEARSQAAQQAAMELRMKAYVSKAEAAATESAASMEKMLPQVGSASAG